MPPAVLMTGNPQPIVRERLAAAFELITVSHGQDFAAAIGDAGPRIRGLASGGHFLHGGPLFDLLPALEIVAHFGVGYDPVDVREAARRGIVVTNTPDVLTEEVADTALGLLLMTVRELSAAERWLRAGHWETKGPYPLTPGSLVGRSLGIVGLGRIGRAIAHRAEAFGLKVAYHTRNPVADAPYPHHATIEGLAAAVDTLMVVVPGTASTRHMINARVLDALGPRGILINVGRGSVVDEAALVDALDAGRILGAGLDVFEHEPKVHPGLLTTPRTVLLPHVGSASNATRDAMGNLQVDNLVAWFEGRAPLTPVPETPVPAR